MESICPQMRAARSRQARVYIFMYLIVIVMSVWLQTWVALLYWVGPFVLAQPFLRAYLMAQSIQAVTIAGTCLPIRARC